MNHAHDHGGHRETNRLRLFGVLLLSSLYMVAEAVGGVLTGSLALLADSGHMLTDVVAVGLSLFALWIAGRPAPAQKTFGYHRAEVLTALANGVSLTAMALLILVEAAERLLQPRMIEAPQMMAIAVGGLVVNLICLWVLHGGRDANLNLRGAWLHLLSDTLGSVGVIVAGGALWAFGWSWFDPLASALIALLIIGSSWRLLKEAVDVLMQSAPGTIAVEGVRTALLAHPAVDEIHDLHIWTITTGMDALSAHVVVKQDREYHDVLADLRAMLHDKFGIDHLTIQIEPQGFNEHRRAIS